MRRSRNISDFIADIEKAHDIAKIEALTKTHNERIDSMIDLELTIDLLLIVLQRSDDYYQPVTKDEKMQINTLLQKVFTDISKYKTEKLTIEIEKSKPVDSNFLKNSLQEYETAFEHFPKDFMHRLYIDFSRADEGPLCFENEKGYRNAMDMAFVYISLTLGKKLNAEEFIKIHDTCINNVKKSNPEVLFKKGISDVHAHYGFHGKNLNKAALDELREEKVLIAITEKDSDQYRSVYAFSKENDFYSISNFMRPTNSSLSEEEISASNASKNRNSINDINILFDKYYEELSNAKDDEAKLTAIARCCRALEVSHVFSDGNQRTIAFALLNKMLIENKLSPCILKDPYCFDGFRTLNEMVSDIREGQGIFQSYKIVPDSDPRSVDSGTESPTPHP